METKAAHVIDLALMLRLHPVRCPYCGETFDANVDTSGGDHEYIEDCHICCRPITFRVTAQRHGDIQNLEARRDDE